jgi:hypothetical protein
LGAALRAVASKKAASVILDFGFWILDVGWNMRYLVDWDDVNVEINAGWTVKTLKL